MDLYPCPNCGEVFQTLQALFTHTQHICRGRLNQKHPAMKKRPKRRFRGTDHYKLAD